LSKPEIILPSHLQDQLNKVSQDTSRPSGRKKIFIALPNMCWFNAGLVSKLFMFAQNQKYEPWFQFVTEVRHADNARNHIAMLFMKSNCDYLLMIDHDTDPHKDIFNLADLDKDISSACVFCWISGELIPSIWEKSPCEQCFCLNAYLKENRIHDEREYRLGPNGELMRWQPFNEFWQPFADKNGILEGQKCRCGGSGKDPFVFTADKNCLGNGKLMQTNSVGTAAILISRRVFEKMTFPWFRFLYREDRSILLTEDHYFCWKAEKDGFEIWADTSLMCSHYKLVDLLQINMGFNKIHMAAVENAKKQQSIVIPSTEEVVALSK
jgi:hypothetical protein